MAATSHHVHSTWNATVRTMLAAAAAVTLVLLAFAWPTYTAKVQHLPLAVAGTAQQVDALDQQLAAAGHPFDVHAVDNRQQAVDQIQHREAYGALVFDGSTTEVLTASAASPAATAVIQQMAQKMSVARMQAAGQARQQAATSAAQLGAKAAAAQAAATTLQQVAAQAPPAQQQAMAPRIAAASQAATQAKRQAAAAAEALQAMPTPSVAVTDVVPLTAKDPRGSGFTVAGLPLAMGGMIGGVLISMLVVGALRRLAAAAGYGVLGGLGMALVLHSWFGFVPGGLLITWAVCGLAIAATAALITGAQSLLGQPGIALGAILTMFIGNPLSSLAMPKEWLPGPWGEVGQFFVPGAAGTLLRLTSYFPQAPQLTGWLVLAGWLVVGVLLTVIGHHASDEVVHIEGATQADRPRRAVEA